MKDTSDRAAPFNGARGRRKGQGLGVYSCNTSLLRLDKRSREYRLMRQVRDDLTDHIGGQPTAVQRMLIERAVILSLRLALLDQKIVDGRLLTTMDNNQYLAWSNSLVRTLRELGVKPPNTDPNDPTDAFPGVSRGWPGGPGALWAVHYPGGRRHQR
jgi:hypothetical protein